MNWSEYLGVIPGNATEVDVIPQNVNEMFDKFHNKLRDLIDEYMPIKAHTISEKKFQKELWVTPGILKSSNKLKNYHNVCTENKSNIRKLGEIINQTIGKESNKTCIIDKLKVENIVYNSSSDIVNEMAN